MSACRLRLRSHGFCTSHTVVETLTAADLECVQQLRRRNYVPTFIRSIQTSGCIRMVFRVEHLRILCYLALCPRNRKRSRLRSWTRVSIYPLPLFGRTFLFTYPFSLFGADANTCGISDEGAPVQHQEIHLPHEGRPYAATLRTRGSNRGKALYARRHRPRMSVCIWRRLTTWNLTTYVL